MAKKTEVVSFETQNDAPVKGMSRRSLLGGAAALGSVGLAKAAITQKPIRKTAAKRARMDALSG